MSSDKHECDCVKEPKTSVYSSCHPHLLSPSRLPWVGWEGPRQPQGPGALGVSSTFGEETLLDALSSSINTADHQCGDGGRVCPQVPSWKQLCTASQEVTHPFCPPRLGLGVCGLPEKGRHAIVACIHRSLVPCRANCDSLDLSRCCEGVP